MAIKRKAETTIRTNVSMGQLVGTAMTLGILIATSYVNLQIKVSQGEVRQNNTDMAIAEIKAAAKDIQTTQNLILQKLGAMEAKVEDVKRESKDK